MAYKRRGSMIQGSRLHKEKLALNCSMDDSSLPDGRANSSAFQHSNHGGAEFIDNHFPSGMHRTDGPMQKHTPAHAKAQEPENPKLNQELAILTGDAKIPGQTGQTSDYEREFMNDAIAQGKGPQKIKYGPMNKYASDAQRKAVHASKAEEGKPYRYKNSYHLPKKKTEGPLLESEMETKSYGKMGLKAALLGGTGVGMFSLMKDLQKRRRADAYNAGFEQSDSDAMEL